MILKLNLIVLIVQLLFYNSQLIEALNMNNVNLNDSNDRKEQILFEKLLKNYNKKIRPSGTVEVKFSLTLNQIVNLIEKEQIMVLNVFIDHEWVDKRLSWNPDEFGNITLIRISGDQIWTPDTFVYTTADQSGFLLPQTGAYFVIRSEGIIFWPNPLTQMRVRCRMGIMWFPFDEQLCIIVFGSWSYTYHYLNYTLMDENPSLENYTENNEWTLVGFKPSRHEIKYNNWIENDTFSEIRYKILIKRKPLFVLQNCVIPAIMLCILTLVSFFIPFAQEMQIGISIMLAFSVFKLRLSDDVPVQSDSVPLINIYFTLCMSFSLTAMIWFSIMNLLREFKHVPQCCRYFVINYVCYIMCIKICKNNTKNVTNKNKTNFPNQKTSNDKKNSFQNVDLNSPDSTYYPSVYLSTPNSPVTYDYGKKSLKNDEKRKRKCSKNKFSKDLEIDYEIERLKETKKCSNEIDEYNIDDLTDSYAANPNMVWVPLKKPNETNQIYSKSKIFYKETYTEPRINIEMSKYDFDDICIQQENLKCGIDSSQSNTPIAAKLSLSKYDNLNSKRDLKSNMNSNRKSISNKLDNESIQTKEDYDQLSDRKIIKILNRFVFYLFLIFILVLNILGLIILPYFVKTPLSLQD